MLTHNELIDSLASHFRARGFIVFKNFPLGDFAKSPPVADLVVVTRSYANFKIAIYEVKANRPDFDREIRTKKWEKYLPYCDQFFFATQMNVCDIDEIPREAGLIFYNEKSWRQKRHCIRKKIFYDFERIKLLQAMIVTRKGA